MADSTERYVPPEMKAGRPATPNYTPPDVTRLSPEVKAELAKVLLQRLVAAAAGKG